MKTTYLFYDIETTGLNKAFDQVMQFAAIRTDTDLNELERHNILVKLNPDIIPSPEAIITHRISVQQCQQQGIAEIDAIRQIHQLMNKPGTISLGYNTLGFDDEFLRFSFYRNLLTPYTHQWANDCGRMDLYPMATMYFLYQKDVIKWPIIDGKPSLKLENISKLNQLAKGQAHNAITDVEATLSLAKKFKQRKVMWDYLLGYFNKRSDAERIRKLTGKALIVDGRYGSDNNFQFPVLSLGQHQHYKNQTLWLRLDDENISKTTIQSPEKTTWVINKKIAEIGFLLPTSNRYLELISPQRQALVESNMQWLEANKPVYKAITDYYRNFTYPKIPNLDIDASLYQSDFLTDAELFLCREFHLASLQDKFDVIERMPERLQEQAIRVMARNYPDYLTDDYYDHYDRYLTHVNPDSENNALTDYRHQIRLTPKSALAKINELNKDNTLDQQQKQLLSGLHNYITKEFNIEMAHES